MARHPGLLRRLIVPLVLLAAAAPLAADTRTFDEVWEKVRQNFYDPKLHGVDWEAMREKYRPEVEAAETTADEHATIRRMLGELRASHLTLIDKEVYRDHFAPEMTGRPKLQAGLEVTAADGAYFVSAVLEGSKAAAAGVRKGDRVVRVNGEAPEDSALLVDSGGDPGIPGDPHYFLRLPEDGVYRLALQSNDEAAPAEVEFPPTKTSMIDATRKSARVIESGSTRMGYIHLWHFLSPTIAAHFDNAIRGPFKDCDGLILDIRGRGGNVFVMNRVLNAIRKKRPFLSYGPRFRKPVVLLIDENSRSAKEIFAYLFRKEKLGPVVGRRTPGAVLGSTFLTLHDGHVLLLPIVDVNSLTDGKRLEGVGVEPTIEVEDPDRCTGGQDLILERGVRELRREVWRRRVI